MIRPIVQPIITKIIGPIIGEDGTITNKRRRVREIAKAVDAITVTEIFMIDYSFYEYSFEDYG